MLQDEFSANPVNCLSGREELHVLFSSHKLKNT